MNLDKWCNGNLPCAIHTNYTEYVMSCAIRLPHPRPLLHVRYVCYDTLTVLKEPVRVHSLSVRHKRISDSLHNLCTSSSNCA